MHGMKVWMPISFPQYLPCRSAEFPPYTATCVTENNAVSITLPTGYASYEWSTGERTNTIKVSKAGTYRATVTR
jgi:hypothetical protein